MIWVEDALHPGVPANHVLTRFTVRGPLDAARFADAFERVVAACDALRMTVERDADRWRAVREGARGAARPEFAETATRSEADRLVAEMARREFAEGGRLWRALLVRIGGDEHLFALDQHHSITDSQSCLLLHAAIERAYARGDLPAMASFADAMAEQHAWGRSEESAAAAAFWSGHLAGIEESGRFYGRAPSRKGASTLRVQAVLSAAASDALRGRRLGAPPSLVFAAAVASWLARVAESSDVVFGVPLLNRPREFAGTPGLLMEIVPNRLRVELTDSFAAVLAKAKAEADVVRPYRRRPLTARDARYEVLLNVHPPAPSSFAGIPAEYELTTPLNVLPADAFAADASPWGRREALTVQVHQHGGDAPYEVSFDVNRRLFGDELPQRALRHFVTLLERAVADPQAAVGRIDLLSDEERALVGVAAPSAPPRDLPTVTRGFAEAARRDGGRVALRHRGRDTTYAELAARTDALAAWFAASGARAGALVGVCLERSPDLVATLLAVLRTGAAYVPLDPSHPGERLRLILDDANPAFVVADAAGVEAVLGATCPLLRIDRDAPPADAAPVDDGSSPEGIAYVIFTSGSTGRPKGVQVFHRSLSAFLAAMREEPGLAADDRFLALTTVSFDIAALELWLPLVTGAAVVLAERADAVDPARISRLLDDEAVTAMQATPATWHMLLRSGWEGRAGLRALVGGEALTPELADELCPRVASLWNMYGPTETTVWSTCARVVRGARPVSIGRPIRGTRAYVLNAAGAPEPPEVAGELHLGGEGVAAGYLARPELTAEKFVADPFASPPGARMYRTGDVARYLPDGSLECLGRRDFQVKIRGYRIELGEIESVLEQHPSVAQAVVVVRGEGPAAMLAAFVRAKGGALDPGDVEAHARRKLPAYMVPSRLAAIAEFPLTPSGKVDRKRLPDVAAPPRAARAAWQPATPYEERLRRIWTEVLGGAEFGGDDSFFDAGGHSLLALELARRIQDALGVNADVGTVFRLPTLREQAAFVERGGDGGGSAVVPLVASGEGAPVYGICGIHLYGELARRLSPRRPFFGVYVPGEQFLATAGAGEDDTPTAEIAAQYWRRIREHRPSGPFHLLGFCFGGMVAYEIARLAAQEGGDVASVVLVDSALWTNMARRHLTRVRNRVRRMLSGNGSPPPAPPAAEPAPAVDLRAERLLARSRVYVPGGKFAGRAVLVRGSEGDLFATWKTTPMLGWEPWFGESSRVITVAGAHDTILRPPVVDDVAAALGPLL